MLLEIFSDANFIHSEPFLIVCKYANEKSSSARVWFTLHCFYEVFTVSVYFIYVIAGLGFDFRNILNKTFIFMFMATL